MQEPGQCDLRDRRLLLFRHRLHGLDDVVGFFQIHGRESEFAAPRESDFDAVDGSSGVDIRGGSNFSTA